MAEADHDGAASFEASRAVGRPRTVLAIGADPIGGAAAKAKGAKVTGLATGKQTWLDERIDCEPSDARAVEQIGARRFDLLLLGRGACRPDVLERFVPYLDDGGHAVAPISESHALAKAGLELLWTYEAGALTQTAVQSSRSFLSPPPPKDAPLHRLYVQWVRPVLGEGLVDANGSLAFGGVVVGRRKPLERPQSLTVGMISMNEEGAVGGVIDDIKEQVPDAEVLLVDSSKDKTPEIAEARGARVVRQFPPRGYGPAMHRLLYEATTDVLVTLDCDGTYPAARIPELRSLIERGFDLVNATRTRRQPEAMPIANYAANRIFAATAQVLHGLPTTDVHSGMRAYRTSMLRGIEVDPQGAALPVDLLVVPARLGYRIAEVEIPYFERIGATTLHRWDSTMWTFRRIARAGLTGGRRVEKGKYEVK